MILLPKMAPAQAAIQPAANGQNEKLTGGVASGQGFEDFLNANQGGAGKRTNPNDLPSGQAAELRKAGEEAARTAAAEIPAAAAQTLPAAPSPSPARKLASKTDGSKSAPPAQQEVPPEALAAMTVQPAPAANAASTSPAEKELGLPEQPSAVPPGTNSSLSQPGLNSRSQAANPNLLSAVQTQSAQTPSIPAQPATTSTPTPAVPAQQAAVSTPTAPVPAQPATAPTQTPTVPALPTPDPASAPPLQVQVSNAGFLANAQAWAVGGGGEGTKAGPAEFAAIRPSSGAKATGRVATQNKSPLESSDNDPVPTLGTSVARQGRAMAAQAQLQETGVSFRTAGPASVESEQPERAALSSAPAATRPAPAQQQAIPSQQPAAQSAQPAQTAPTAAFSIATPASFTQSVAGTPAALPGHELANTTLNQVMESADKMQSDGKSNVALQVKLDDGQQISIHLQITQGSIRPVFKTESPELRQAIEQNWAGFRSAASERGLNISTPVFESPSSGGSFNAYGNRDQSRGSSGDPSDAEAGQPSPQTPFRPSGNPVVSQSQAAPPVGSGVQMYA
jgi:hypothetical protein